MCVTGSLACVYKTDLLRVSVLTQFLCSSERWNTCNMHRATLIAVKERAGLRG